MQNAWLRDLELVLSLKKKNNKHDTDVLKTNPIFPPKEKPSKKKKKSKKVRNDTKVISSIGENDVDKNSPENVNLGKSKSTNFLNGKQSENLSISNRSRNSISVSNLEKGIEFRKYGVGAP